MKAKKKQTEFHCLNSLAHEVNETDKRCPVCNGKVGKFECIATFRC